MFAHVQPYAGDPILGLMENFAQDSRPGKVNLGVGIYYDEKGKLPVLQSVRVAASRVFEANLATSYLPIEGDRNYRLQVAGLLFAEEASKKSDSLAVIQSVGGSGALKVGADFLKNHFPKSRVYVSDPTWDNHIGIFEGAGFPVHCYRYYSAETKGFDLVGMLQDLNRLDEHDIVLLHACCHNPTGADPTPVEWLEILNVVEERNLIAFVDMAYQGFAEGLADDAFVVRELARRNLDFLVSNSFSKIFSLYGERCGALTVHCATPKESANVLGQLKFTVRRNYSSPPTQGMRLIATVLSDGLLQRQWHGELEGMRLRIASMRKELCDLLGELVPSLNFDFLIKQRGMFAYTGMSAAQVAALQTNFGIYAVSSGRICVAGLNMSNIDYVAEAFARVLR